MGYDVELNQQLAEQREQQLEDLQEYLDVFPMSMQEVEEHLQNLSRNPQDRAELNALFRALHTVKSNAAMCNLEGIVTIAHPLEDLVGAIRAGALRFTPLVGEVILLVLDRIRLTAQYMSAGQSLASLHLPEMLQAMRDLYMANRDEVDDMARAAVQKITGGEVVQPHITEVSLPQPEAKADIYNETAAEEQKEDLRFFRQMSLQLEKRSGYWEGRTDRLLQLAMQTNAAAGHPVDPVQLEAAIYIHDIGMAMLPESIWTKEGRLDDVELAQVRQHTVLGAGLLERMAGWSDAAEMVLQHHERLDGTGYPLALNAQQIHPGAKLIAILDAFEAMTHPRADRQFKKSAMRAITELNACADQFTQDWVRVFNPIVRKLLAGNAANG
ncbi:HD domain-containing phosphohydrolase [Parvibium lacunae]|uniref:HD domain-containing protein n=1 Tax=Parvibium lacunae TaxID=1888893 RepID=A0A368L084_9BURK|nr:HD domain-containing phosphohydrolase [Parvibium lacunae]RCS56832.1 HD domain-containing protein [Parvibium lacunae]